MDMKKYLADLEKLVNIDCGSNVPEGVQEVTEFFKKELENEWIIKVYPQNDGKNPVLVAKNRDSEDIDLMFLGHNDTVFPKGTVPAWSYKLEGNIATGAGVYDMKSGVLSMIEVAKEFKNEDITIALVMNTDEEISSRYSRPVIEEIGKNAKYAMVFEPARKNGNAVIERKGLVKYKVEFFGKSSHAGNYPQEGINAILEASRWVTEISKLHNWDIKNSLNVGLIEGGSGVNIVPDYACIKFEGRSHQVEFFETIRKTMEDLKANPLVDGIKVEIEEIGYRPPLVLNDKSATLRNLFDESKAEMGIKYDWEVAGGCSDGNFLGVLGVGVVDAVGPVGGEAHSKNEYLDISTIEERINLAKAVVRKMIDRKKDNIISEN